MQLEGKVLGYNKKTLLAVVYTLVIICVAFYAGAKYEKSKLISMGYTIGGNSATHKSSGKSANKAKKTTANPQDNSASQSNGSTGDNTAGDNTAGASGEDGTGATN